MVQASSYRPRLETLKQALDSFEKALEIETAPKDPVEADAIRNGQALKFGYCMELLWKAMKSFLYEQHGIECNSPKSCIKFFFQNTNISESDYRQLNIMVNQRNELSHMYNKRIFEELLNSLPGNLTMMKKCLKEFS